MFIYNLIFKPTIAAFFVMLSWGNQATINSYKFFFQKRIENSNIQIIKNVKSGGKLTIIQNGNGNKYQEINNVKVNGDFHVTQSGSTITSTNGSRININRSNISGSNITATNNSTISISGANIYSKPGNNTVKINNANIDEEIDIEQGSTEGSNSVVIKDCGTISGGIKVRQGNANNSDSFSTINFPQVNFPKDFNNFSFQQADIKESPKCNYAFQDDLSLEIGKNIKGFTIESSNREDIAIETTEGAISSELTQNVLSINSKKGALCKLYLPSKKKFSFFKLINKNGDATIGKIWAKKIELILKDSNKVDIKNCDIDEVYIDATNVTAINLTNISVTETLTLNIKNITNLITQNTSGLFSYECHNSNVFINNHAGMLSGVLKNSTLSISNNITPTEDIQLTLRNTKTNLSFGKLSQSTQVDIDLKNGDLKGNLTNYGHVSTKKDIITFNRIPESTLEAKPLIEIGGKNSTVIFNTGGFATS